MIFCDSYLPGHRGGGGMWAVRNVAARFSERYDIFIVTRDCDGKIDSTPYVKIPRNRWTERPEATVYYASPSDLNSKTFARLTEEIGPHAIYLNSVFSKVCTRLLFAQRRLRNRQIPLLIAPCGELAAAAIHLKYFRKRMFLFFAQAFGLFRFATWKAASIEESNDIKRVISVDVKISVAPELTPRDILPGFTTDEKPTTVPESVRLSYLSRVTRIKNLHYLLELLNVIDAVSIRLEVIGPADDDRYLEKCRQIADSLPSNIDVDFIGGVDHESALARVKESHFMVLPTSSENFGYAIIESMAAGCPVVLSDRVAWSDVTENNAGWRIPLEDREAWLKQLAECVSMGHEEYLRFSSSARNFAVKYLLVDGPMTENQLMFDSVLELPYLKG